MADRPWKSVGRVVLAVFVRWCWYTLCCYSGWYMGRGIKHIGTWILPSDAPESAQFALFMILTIGLFVLVARFIGLAREELRDLRASWSSTGEVPLAVTVALFSIFIALISGICGAAWAGWLS